MATANTSEKVRLRFLNYKLPRTSDSLVVSYGGSDLLEKAVLVSGQQLKRQLPGFRRKNLLSGHEQLKFIENYCCEDCRTFSGKN